MIVRKVLFACGVLVLGAVPSFADVYDAVNDFPNVPVSSQNGVWSYGYATGVGPVNFVLHTNTSPDYFGDGKAEGFYTPFASYALPTVLKNVSGGTIPAEDTIGPWPNNLLLIHPGQGGQTSVVRFTAPTTQTYFVTGQFLAIGNYSGVTNDAVYLTTSGPVSSQLLSTTSLTVPHTFSFSQSLAAGESLDFVVGLGPGDQFYYDSTGFNATITAPEPGFYAVMSLGLTGLLVALRRRTLLA